jgi:hypothetical protein
VYDNITFVSLGRLLGVSAEEAEELASKMIREGRLHGVIDQVSAPSPPPIHPPVAPHAPPSSFLLHPIQVDGVLEFSGSAESLTGWDTKLKLLCNAVNDAVDAIGQVHPALLAV